MIYTDSMIFKFPTHISPKNALALPNLRLSPGPRINLTRFGSGGHTNSIQVEIDKDGEDLRNWVRFHSFINNSCELVDYYLDERSYKIEDVRPKSQMPRNFENFLSVIYWRTADYGGGVPVVSYSDLYAEYLSFDQPKQNLITAYIAALTTKDSKPSRMLFNRAYWRIVQYYSIIESIVGQPSFCPCALGCEKCGSTGLQHYSVSAAKHLQQALAEIIKDEKLIEHYQAIILTARNEIRHSTVHAALQPSGKRPALKDGEQIYYDTEKSVKTHKQDLYALTALEGRLEEATWHILMDRLYGHGIFEFTRGHSVALIVANFSKQERKPNTSAQR